MFKPIAHSYHRRSYLQTFLHSLELSGKPLDGMAEVHHKDRVADKPERAFDPTNLAVIRKDEHSEYHNSDYPQNEKGYEQFEKKYKK